MSARKIDTNTLDFSSVPTKCLTLSAESVRIRKNGIEFHNEHPLSPWTEMTITLQSPADNGRVNCNGVVIACTGNKHAGYHVSLVFTSLTKQAQSYSLTLTPRAFILRYR